MNAVVLTKGWSHQRLLGRIAAREMVFVLSLGFAVLTSAIAVVAVKQQDRQLFIETQGLQTQITHQQTEWGQLLLEESTWSTQARIQTIAQNQLNMAVPSADAIKVVKMT